MNEKREAELRRLQDRLLDRITTAEDQAERAVAGCERLRAQRDALLEAASRVARIFRGAMPAEDPAPALDALHAAIKMVKGEKE